MNCREKLDGLDDVAFILRGDMQTSDLLAANRFLRNLHAEMVSFDTKKEIIDAVTTVWRNIDAINSASGSIFKMPKDVDTYRQEAYDAVKKLRLEMYGRAASQRWC